MIKVGEKLAEERKKQGYTLEQVAKATKIRLSFLEAIEKGEYKLLPGSSYAQGFVKNYIEFLDLPQKDLLALFRREFNEREYIDVLPKSFVKKEEIPLQGFRLQRTGVILGSVIVMVLFYLFFQYRAAFFSPSLVITTPQEKEKVSTQSLVVSGQTDANTTVTINGFPTVVDSNGHFSKEVPVFPGNATITAKVANSFGKITTIERHVIVLIGQ